ncbi:class I SAM-dependent methyltransferase [Nocardioides anomalus]|uniref:Class I SAM-dependent methyltransferase n=1 Tax=Nocardioides anomalus TaxID=2712223 RepID=A0A6G6WIM1_9ACTN|nr:class I SAM-dependent methyltransferase [Nocardioides anomalus]QIG45178.1 class I SAM-dependent methyltransferase [Nocardioides anomalus]
MGSLWAERSSSFGTVARAYAEHRPDYAAEAIAWSLAGARRPVAEVLDLAAGTGALTGGLLAAGVAVTAVEPDAEMLGELRRRHPGVPTALGRAEAIPLADEAVDAVLVGTAYHWFDPNGALPEIARVLRPGGVLALLYNTPDESVPWVAELGRLSRSSVSTPPDDAKWQPDLTGFGSVEMAAFAHRQRRTAVSLTETVGTHSHTVVIPAEERAEVLGRVRAFLEENPATAHGEFDHPLRTRAARAVVLGPA